MISLHRREHGKFYPSRDDGAIEYVGKGTGAGFNINIAWDTNVSEVDEYDLKNNKASDLGSNEYKLAFE